MTLYTNIHESFKLLPMGVTSFVKLRQSPKVKTKTSLDCTPFDSMKDLFHFESRSASKTLLARHSLIRRHASNETNKKKKGCNECSQTYTATICEGSPALIIGIKRTKRHSLLKVTIVYIVYVRLKPREKGEYRGRPIPAP
jgi:hypothetical protein